jgi:subtilase family serine protease
VADYQAEAVSSFFSTNQFPFKSYNVTAGDSIGANGGVFNVDGRGMPDVSANGAAFDFFLRGNFHSGFGTSLAAPIWGAIITLVKNDLLRKEVITNLYQDYRSTNCRRERPRWVHQSGFIPASRSF